MIKTIIFDYDGTIHQTLGIYEPAFRETYQWLTEQKVAEEQKIASSKIAGWLGLNSKEMWDTFMPELDQKYKDQASKMVGERMIEQVRKHKAVWYPGAEKMLTTLKNQGYYLVVLSNCKTAYRKAHWEEFGMKRWFERFYDCESYGFRPKDLYSYSQGAAGGSYKNSDNVIAETDAKGHQKAHFIPVPAFQTAEAMEEPCTRFLEAWEADRIDKLILIPMFILDFLCIHPFNDGNGRMSRLLTLLFFIRRDTSLGNMSVWKC